MKKYRNENVWLLVVVVLTVLLITAEIIDNIIGGNSSISNEVQKTSAGWVAVGALITFMTSIVALFKMTKFRIGVGVLASLFSLIIFGLAFFAWSLGGDGVFTF